MRKGKSAVLVLLLLAVPTIICAASNARATTAEGTVVSEKSADCGSQRKGHKKTLDLLCQEYVVRTSSVEYHIRQSKDSAKQILPVHAKIDFILDKDKMKFTLDGKKYEFRVVAEHAIEDKPASEPQSKP